MPAARYQSDRFDGTGGAAENEAIARIRGTGSGLIDQVISASCDAAAAVQVISASKRRRHGGTMGTSKGT